MPCVLTQNLIFNEMALNEKFPISNALNIKHAIYKIFWPEMNSRRISTVLYSMKMHSSE